MKNIVIIGAGGFGREVKWLIDRINLSEESMYGRKKWNFLGFIDDKPPETTKKKENNILGNCEWLEGQKEELAVACAVGAAETRKNIINRIDKNQALFFPNLIDPSVCLSEDVKMGKGTIICAGSILTVDIQIGDFCIINLDCTVGHDTKMESYVTLYPSVNLSGNTTIEEGTEIGTGSHIIQGIVIGKGAIVGAGTVVIKRIPAQCTIVGNPARIIKAKNSK